jgi:WD40 repeat protein
MTFRFLIYSGIVASFFSLWATLCSAQKQPTAPNGAEPTKPAAKVEVAKPQKVDIREAYRLAFSGDSKTLACASLHEVSLFDVESLKRIATFRMDEDAPPRSRIEAIAFSPASDMLVIAEGISLRIWRTADKKLLRTVKVDRNVQSIAFSANGKFATTGDMSGVVTLWNGDLSEKTKSLRVDRMDALYSPLSPDGQLVYAQGLDDLYLWKPRTGKTLTTLSEVRSEEFGWREHEWVTDISPDGKLIAISGGDDGIVIAEANSLKTLYREPQREVKNDRLIGRTAKFLGESDRIVASRGDHYLAIHSISPEIKFEFALPPPPGELGGIGVFVVSPNGKFVVSEASIRVPNPGLFDVDGSYERSVWLHQLSGAAKPK